MTDKELEVIIKENEWVVNDVISKYQHLVDRDELYAVGLMGLYEGIKKYDNTKNTKLSTYARHWVKARVLAAVYENRTVHIPWNKINNYIKAKKDNPEAIGISGYSTAVDYTPKYEISLDAFSTTDDDDGNSDNIEIHSSLSSQDLHIMEEKDMQSFVATAIEETPLSDLERKAITLRFGLDRQEKPMTFSEVGSMTGLSTMGAQKVVMRGIGKLKKTPMIKDLLE